MITTTYFCPIIYLQMLRAFSPGATVFLNTWRKVQVASFDRSGSCSLVWPRPVQYVLGQVNLLVFFSTAHFCKLLYCGSFLAFFASRHIVLLCLQIFMTNKKILWKSHCTLASHILLELDQLDGGVPTGLPCPALQRCDVVAYYVSAKGGGRLRRRRGGIRHLLH